MAGHVWPRWQTGNLAASRILRASSISSSGMTKLKSYRCWLDNDQLYLVQVLTETWRGTP
jgi:hypothetical protein